MMKPLIFAFFFVFANVRAGLLDMWKLDNPIVDFSSESNTFRLSYDLNKDVTKESVHVKVFTAACQDPQDGTEGIEVTDGITVQNTDVSDGKGIFEFKLDIKTLSNNSDVIDTSNPQRPSIKLCARYMLWTGGTYEVSFIESILALNFDLTDAGFVFSNLVSKNFDSSGTEVS
uniref:Uncharacterized protein n=1 Tax=Pseudo-nitzschia australis TaxID=44445 RepID=A0A7S4EEV6_9STRA|mmetsp:Transcript_9292/g.19746  ORF Transcript_9292/g.19746 Transcript_9292/m.19746 type:complete len:173 (-) Transcript_9292:335-853(-)|eukprot:CAMPEP_0168184152 /NCGR_PEP_ID=MMETSP0139_2-20121125/13051_1 /TAXON_ID=44445 /ORGANISM="Pseudo-nitzschia australis, Strain 10249 10 AB" /LENGTH=172 /DNA_ID=CAMNT_0008105683 /DNA_START=102 /DNA_END=620 /DNA_ORIENTATION=-